MAIEDYIGTHLGTTTSVDSQISNPTMLYDFPVYHPAGGVVNIPSTSALCQSVPISAIDPISIDHLVTPSTGSGAVLTSYELATETATTISTTTITRIVPPDGQITITQYWG